MISLMEELQRRVQGPNFPSKVSDCTYWIALVITTFEPGNGWLNFGPQQYLSTDCLRKTKNSYHQKGEV